MRQAKVKVLVIKSIKATVTSLLFLLALGSSFARAEGGAASPTDLGFFFTDYLTMQIGWDWAKGSGADATGFHIYCGNKLDVDSTGSWTADQVLDVPSKDARQFLVGPAIDAILNQYGTKVLVDCVVLPYNASGEAGELGGPDNAQNVRFLQ